MASGKLSKKIYKLLGEILNLQAGFQSKRRLPYIWKLFTYKKLHLYARNEPNVWGAVDHDYGYI